jgi:hypothetical protein
LTIHITPQQARWLRLRGQGLLSTQPDAADTAARVARRVCGLQAQDMFAAALGVRARSRGSTFAAFELARAQERSVVCTWAMRGTLHLLASDDLGWLLPLVGPVFVAAAARRRQELGLDEATYQRGVRALTEYLAVHGPSTRPELSAALASAGLPIGYHVERHLLYRAGLEGIVCLGPDRRARPTIALLEEWLRPPRDSDVPAVRAAGEQPPDDVTHLGPPRDPDVPAARAAGEQPPDDVTHLGLPRDPGILAARAAGEQPPDGVTRTGLPRDLAARAAPDPEAGAAYRPTATDARAPGALAELAARYLAAYAPATPADLAAWSGLPSSMVQRAWAAVAGGLVEVRIAGSGSSSGLERRAWLPAGRLAELDAPEPASPSVRLLPAFDTYLLGYRGRELAVETADAARVNAGGGMIRPVLLVDGQVAGTWRTGRKGRRLDIAIDAFAGLSPEVAAGVAGETADIHRFLLPGE